MVQHQDMGALLSSAGFKLTTVDVDEIVVNYPSMFELMTDLKAMGEGLNCNTYYRYCLLFNLGNALVDRKKYVPRDTFMAANQIYKAVYGKDDKVPATFQM
jgi:NADH dehydrogenase [ubiquinone] 1 alpha subcomplex assembly factor 5